MKHAEEGMQVHLCTSFGKPVGNWKCSHYTCSLQQTNLLQHKFSTTVCRQVHIKYAVDVVFVEKQMYSWLICLLSVNSAKH